MGEPPPSAARIEAKPDLARLGRCELCPPVDRSGNRCRAAALSPRLALKPGFAACPLQAREGGERSVFCALSSLMQHTGESFEVSSPPSATASGNEHTNLNIKIPVKIDISGHEYESTPGRNISNPHMGSSDEGEIDSAGCRIRLQFCNSR